MTTTTTAFPSDPAGVITLSVATWAVVTVPVFLRYRSRTRRTASSPQPHTVQAHPQPVTGHGPYDPGAFTIERNLP